MRSLALCCATFTLAIAGVLDPGSASAADPAGTIYVADYAANAIDVFAPGANGDVAPVRRIVGPATGLSGPADVAVDSAGDVYSSNFNSSTITEYAPGASGDEAPVRSIGGELTKLGNNDDISLATDGQIYVGNRSGNPAVEVFAAGASGNVAPIRTIDGEATGLAFVDGLGVDATGTVYVDSGASIRAFAPGASGNAAPVRVIEGETTQLAAPDDVKADFSGRLFVSDFPRSAHVFEPGAVGDVAPARNITGEASQLTSADDLAVSPEGAMYITNFATANVVEFAPAANGNVAPVAQIAGSETTLGEPEGVALATPPAQATLATKAAVGSIALGQPTRDTATLEGGSSPSGELIFKLFGPGDPTCSRAPAFISGLVEVTGNGSYESPAFTPTAAGAYSWVAEYGGDGANAAKASGCNDAGEQVGVQEGAEAKCTSVHGNGHWGARGPEGGNLGDALSTNLGEKQALQATAPAGQFRVRLTHLQSAACVVTGSGLEFSGSGTAALDHQDGYQIGFAIAVRGGHTYFTLAIEKEGAVLYALTEQELRRDGTEHVS